MMTTVGLIPRHRRPGGREIGQRISHFFSTGGAFERAVPSCPTSASKSRCVELREHEVAPKKKAGQDPLQLPGLGPECLGEAGRAARLRRLRHRA